MWEALYRTIVKAMASLAALPFSWLSLSVRIPYTVWSGRFHLPGFQRVVSHLPSSAWEHQLPCEDCWPRKQGFIGWSWSQGLSHSQSWVFFQLRWIESTTSSHCVKETLLSITSAEGTDGLLSLNSLGLIPWIISLSKDWRDSMASRPFWPAKVLAATELRTIRLSFLLVQSMIQHAARFLSRNDLRAKHRM